MRIGTGRERARRPAEVTPDRISVVVQGPVVGTRIDASPDRWTLRALESVRRQLPGAEVVLSTWRGADVDGLPFDVIVQADDPGTTFCEDPQLRADRVAYDANRQIASVGNGLRAATRPYAMKLRSDMELTSSAFLGYFRRYNERADQWQAFGERVVATTDFSRNPRGRLAYPFHPSDWFHFGRIEDLRDLWNIPFATDETIRWFETRPREPEDTERWALYRYTVEQYLWTSFLRKHGELDFNHKTDLSHDAIDVSELTIANNLVLASPADLGIKFLEYELSPEDRLSVYTHADWRRLYKTFCHPSFPLSADLPPRLDRARLALSRIMPRGKADLRLAHHVPSLKRDQPSSAASPVPAPDAPKIAVIIQGPVYERLNGYSTIDVVRAVASSPLRGRLHVVYSVWDTEPTERCEAVRPYVDEIVSCPQPALWGSGNRNLQRQGVSAALDALEGRGFEYVLKTRSDFVLTEALLRAVVTRADAGFDRVLVTNIFTRYEPFHVSDMMLFGRLDYIRRWFDPREVYYQDLYSPEVQFARVFVRNMGLSYPMTQQGYLRFLRDWIDLIDFNEYGLAWFKDPEISRRSANASNWVIYDRDCGPVLTRVLKADYPAWLRRTRVPTAAIATWLILHDTLKRFVVVHGSSFLERVCHLHAHYTSLNLPGDKILDVKIGASPRRFKYYSVDPMGREVGMPIGARPRRPPPTSLAPTLETDGRGRWLRIPLLAARIRTATRTSERTAEQV